MTYRDKIKTWLQEDSELQFDTEADLERAVDDIVRLTLEHLSGIQLEFPVASDD